MIGRLTFAALPPPCYPCHLATLGPTYPNRQFVHSGTRKSGNMNPQVGQLRAFVNPTVAGPVAPHGPSVTADDHVNEIELTATERPLNGWILGRHGVRGNGAPRAFAWSTLPQWRTVRFHPLTRTCAPQYVRGSWRNGIDQRSNGSVNSSTTTPHLGCIIRL